MAQYWILLIPVFLIVAVLFIFLKGFSKLGIKSTTKQAKKIVVIQIIVSFIFYFTLLLWCFLGVKIFGQISFNIILILGGMWTAIMYACIDKEQLGLGLRTFSFFLSIIPWFIIPVLGIPGLGLFIFHQEIKPTLGMSLVAKMENENYRLDQSCPVLTSGGQYYYYFVKKYSYFDRIEETIGHPEEIELRFSKYFENKK